MKGDKIHAYSSKNFIECLIYDKQAMLLDSKIQKGVYHLGAYILMRIE